MDADGLTAALLPLVSAAGRAIYDDATATTLQRANALASTPWPRRTAQQEAAEYALGYVLAADVFPAMAAVIVGPARDQAAAIGVGRGG